MKRQDLEKLRKQGFFLSTDRSYFPTMLRTEILIHWLNKTPVWNIPVRNFLICQIIGKIDGNPLSIQNPFRVSCGENISIGKNFYSNFNCCILDRTDVVIGNNVYLAPNVTITTTGHPLDANQRKMFLRNDSFEPKKRSCIEMVAPVKIGNNVWICTGSIVCPGVTIGDNTVIGAGSVVTKNIPSNVLAYGVPCRVVRKLNDSDKKTLDEIKALVNENVQEFHRPTHYKIRTAIPLTKNNKNNITALKIEDTATMFDGVISADIEAHNTSEYEFLLIIKINSDKSDNEIIEALEKHINKIANIIKFNVGKIKYEIERV